MSAPLLLPPPRLVWTTERSTSAAGEPLIVTHCDRFSVAATPRWIIFGNTCLCGCRKWGFSVVPTSRQREALIAQLRQVLPRTWALEVIGRVNDAWDLYLELMLDAAEAGVLQVSAARYLEAGELCA